MWKVATGAADDVGRGPSSVSTSETTPAEPPANIVPTESDAGKANLPEGVTIEPHPKLKNIHVVRVPRTTAHRIHQAKTTGYRKVD